MIGASTAGREPGRRLTPLSIVGIYALVGGLWVLFSDRLLTALVSDPVTLTRLGTLKGWLYVLVTSGLLYALINRHEAAMLHANEMLEQHVEERTRDLSTLLAVSHTVTSTLELEPLLTLILEQLQSVVDYTGASVFIADEEALTLQAYLGPFSQAEALRVRIWRQQPLFREVIASQKPVAISDVLSDTSPARGFQAWASTLGQSDPDITPHRIYQHIRSWLGVPLVAKGQVIGVLTLTDSEPDRFSAREVRLVNAFANQVAVAMENARLYRKAEHLAAMEERERLARELHDSVTQALYSVTLYAEAARMALSAGKSDVAIENLHELHSMAREAMLDMRMLIFELHPPALAEEGLVAALQTRLASVEARAGLHTAFQAEGKRRLPLAVEEELFWIAVEAFNNVVKHAGAQKVTVQVRFDDAGARLEVRDDGRGFDPAEAGRSGGMGLRGIKERVQRIHGQLAIDNHPRTPED
jgi:signal transduction histidine kinase